MATHFCKKNTENVSLMLGYDINFEPKNPNFFLLAASPPFEVVWTNLWSHTHGEAFWQLVEMFGQVTLQLLHHHRDLPRGPRWLRHSDRGPSADGRQGGQGTGKASAKLGCLLLYVNFGGAKMASLGREMMMPLCIYFLFREMGLDISFCFFPPAKGIRSQLALNKNIPKGKSDSSIQSHRSNTETLKQLWVEKNMPTISISVWGDAI